MDLYLIRHAQAQDGHLYGEDAERPLTADGRRAAREVGRAIAEQGVGFDAVIVSPLVRAVETAELIAVEVGYEGALQVSSELEPEGRSGRVVEKLVEPATVERLALVGHEPSMGKLLSHLVGKHGLSLSKGAVVRLRWDGKAAHYVWAVKPKRLEPVKTIDGI